jgi:hypothetical protein
MIAGTVILASVVVPLLPKPAAARACVDAAAIAACVDKGQAGVSNAVTTSTRVEA